MVDGDKVQEEQAPEAPQYSWFQKICRFLLIFLTALFLFEPGARVFCLVAVMPVMILYRFCRWKLELKLIPTHCFAISCRAIMLANKFLRTHEKIKNE